LILRGLEPMGDNAMPVTQQLSEALAVDLARECLYRFLAAALVAPPSESFGLVLDPEDQRLAGAAADLLRAEASTEPVALGFGELPADALTLRPLLAELHQPREQLAAEYDRVFGLVLCRECPPYETEYHPSSESFFCSQQMADVAGFYGAFGLATAQAVPERPDYLGLELEFMAFLLLKKRLALASAEHNPDAAEQARVCDAAQRDFFRDHLAWWVPSFATGLRRKAGGGFYAALGTVLAALLPVERGRLGVEPPRLPLQVAVIERPEEQAACAGCSA
jgi:TorA maturation chaperone TorD